MSATKQATYEEIVALRTQIDEATNRGEDVKLLQEQLTMLNKKWMQLCENEQHSSNLIKG